MGTGTEPPWSLGYFRPTTERRIDNFFLVQDASKGYEGVLRASA